MFRKPWRHPMPHDMGLRVPVQQKHRRAASPMTQVDDGLGGLDSAMREVLEHPAVILQFS
jgi:hypothetical protein